MSKTTRSTNVKHNTQQAREERLRELIHAATARGETISEGVYLISSREPTAAEIAYGMELEDLAIEVLREGKKESPGH